MQDDPAWDPEQHHQHPSPNLRKITDYLLSHEHPTGRWKAQFFESFGFSAERPGELLAALLDLRDSMRGWVGHEETQWGAKGTVEGRLSSPDGRDRGYEWYGFWNSIPPLE